MGGAMSSWRRRGTKANRLLPSPFVLRPLSTAHCPPVQRKCHLHVLVGPIPVVFGAFQDGVEAIVKTAGLEDADHVLPTEVVGLPGFGRRWAALDEPLHAGQCP